MFSANIKTMQMKCARNGTFFNEEKVRGDIGPFLDDRHKKVEEGLVNERTEGEWAKASNTALRPNYAGDAVPGILPGRCGKTYYQKLLEEGEIESLNVLEMTPEEAMELDLSSLSLNGEPGLEEVKRILKEYRETIKERRKKEERLDGEIREVEGKLTNMGKEVTIGKSEGETVEDRIRKYPFSDEQLEEAMAGIENGLSEETVLSYFKIDTTATKMRVLRKLAEKAAGKGVIKSIFLQNIIAKEHCVIYNEISICTLYIRSQKCLRKRCHQSLWEHLP